MRKGQEGVDNERQGDQARRMGVVQISEGAWPQALIVKSKRGPTERATEEWTDAAMGLGRALSRETADLLSGYQSKYV